MPTPSTTGATVTTTIPIQAAVSVGTGVFRLDSLREERVWGRPLSSLLPPSSPQTQNYVGVITSVVVGTECGCRCGLLLCGAVAQRFRGKQAAASSHTVPLLKMLRGINNILAVRIILQEFRELLGPSTSSGRTVFEKYLIQPINQPCSPVVCVARHTRAAERPCFAWRFCVAAGAQQAYVPRAPATLPVARHPKQPQI